MAHTHFIPAVDSPLLVTALLAATPSFTGNTPLLHLATIPPAPGLAAGLIRIATLDVAMAFACHMMISPR